MLNIVQHVVMPNLDFGATEELYVRAGNQNVAIHTCERALVFMDGGQVNFDTFFNGFTVDVWKKNCQLNDLFIVIKGSGRFLLRFGLHRMGHAHRWLTEQVVECKQCNDVIIELPFWDKLDDGMLYFYLEALTEATFKGGFFATSTLPVQNVRLGIVITHFNRKQFVIPAIQRINDQLLNDPLYKGNIDLIVVDNSKSISDEESYGITIIPNKNLGGSGGFTRGVLHLKDDGAFTHCLFMDDDASCEVESIRRCYHLLEYSTTEKFAVSGALMREFEPYRLHEKGALFAQGWLSLKQGLDLRNVEDLLFAEREDKKIKYGAWWFFAFKISDVQHYAFPFFVRGDDVQFGLQNDFSICTLNGIGCWGDDFGYKDGPLTRYLTARSLFLLMSVFGDAGLLTLLKIMCLRHLSALFSYNYASAKAARLAVTHFQLGPNFWIDNMDMSAIRAQIAGFSASEKLEPVKRFELQLTYPELKNTDDNYIELNLVQGSNLGEKECLLRRILRVLSLNGFLLPSFMLKKGVVFQHKSSRANFQEIFLYREILYEYVPTGLGYIAEHDKKKFFTELLAFSRELWRFAFRYKSLKREYIKALPEMTSEEFWRKIYSDH